MGEKIGIMLLFTCLLTGVVSGCGAAESSLTGESNAVTIEENGGQETTQMSEMSRPQAEQSDRKQVYLEKTDGLWGQEEWEEDEWEQEGGLLWEGLDQKTLTIVCYTDADGNEFYITDEGALKELSVLLGGLRGLPYGYEKLESDICFKMDFRTADGGGQSCIIYEGNYLYCYDDRCYKMQDDFEEVIASLLYFTSTDHLLSQVESEEGRQTINGILEEEGSQLIHLVADRVEDLDYCLFETSAGKGFEFHLLLWGSWEGKEVLQHQVFPLNEEEGFPLAQLSEWCEVSKEDMDLDGRPDLLIYEGYNVGYKSGFMHYRVMRWDEGQGQFVFYPSFPFWVTFLDLENKQVLYKAKGAGSDRNVRIYEAVEGEYRVVQELDISSEYVSETYWGKIYIRSWQILSYYEDGELVWECDVSEMNWDEMEDLCREQNLEGLSEAFSHARDYG